jgi:thymidylate kinase
MDYEENGIPREDMVIFLYLPATYSQKLLLGKGERGYIQGKLLDIQEADVQYQQKSEEMYLSLAERFDHWIKVDCLDAQGEFKSREQIHEEIKSILYDRRILDQKAQAPLLQSALSV